MRVQGSEGDSLLSHLRRWHDSLKWHLPSSQNNSCIDLYLFSCRFSSSSCLLPFYWLDPLNTQEPITFRVLRKNAYFTTFCVEESKLYSQIHLSNEMKRSSTTRTAAVMLTWLTCLASSQDIFHHFLPKNNPREASICCLRNARFLLISLVSFVRKRTPTVSEQHSPQILQELLPA